jgi:hypothetical protein
VNVEEIEPDSDLDIAANELLSAWRKYREFVKRNYPERLHGVMIVRNGNEIIVHSESAKYSEQVMRLTWNSTTDSFGLSDIVSEEDRENAPQW